MATYTDKLNSPFWQRKRLEIFNRDNFKCTNCGSIHRQLQVHHLEYFGNIAPQDYPNDMLVTLCDQCHEKENKRPRHEKFLISSLKMKGFLVDDILRLSTKLDTDPIFTNFLRNLLRKL